MQKKRETLQYFSGFCLSGEKELFSEYLSNSEYEVAGFSYGAIKAYEYCLTTKKRVDKLTLLSPAFFLDKDEKFKRLQLLHFRKNKNKYIENFLQNCSYPCETDLQKYLYPQSIKELEELLNYKWNQKLKDIDIRVYLGENDKIIDSKKAHEFFKEFTTSYYMKQKGHILCKR